MAHRPDVSIVMGFFNGERFIREAVDSVLAQTYPGWELLLVDDGSDDRSTALALDYARRHGERIAYLEHPGHANRGVCASRNLAVKSAKGDYLALLDVDDVWTPTKLESQLAILASQPRAALVCGASDYWFSWSGDRDHEGRDHVPALGVQGDRLYEPPTLLTLLYPLGPGTAPCPSDLLMRRDLLERVGGFEEDFRGAYQLYEDQAFLTKVYATAPVFIASDCWTRYRIHADSCVSIVTRAGRYHEVRLFFLNWLRDYLTAREIVDEAIWRALEEALAPYNGAKRIGHEADRPPRTWWLRVEAGNSAKLDFPQRDETSMRVSIESAGTDVTHDIQLNRPRLGLKAHQRYSIAFRGRADAERNVGLGIARAASPWSNLGFYVEVELTPEWRTFEHEFVCVADDDNARIHFDLGGWSTSVDLSAVEVRSVTDGVVINPPEIATDLSTDLQQPPEYWQRLVLNGAPGATRESATRGEHRGGPSARPDLLPVSADWGWDRGLPIDRYYIEQFFRAQADDIRGRVLEIGHNVYTRTCGGQRVTSSDVLNVQGGDPYATIVADLTAADQVPADTFDCVICPQTLQYIYEVRAAVATMYRALRPAGVLLATFPGISRIRHDDPSGSWYWLFTSLSAQQLFGEFFGTANVRIRAYGNVRAAVSFLQGLAAQELSADELDFRDPNYEMLITVRAVK